MSTVTTVLHDEEGLDVEEGGGGGDRSRNLIEFTHLSISHISIPQEDDADDEEEGNDEHGSEDQESKPFVEEEQISPVAPNFHGVLQVLVPNEHRRFYEKVWLARVFKKLTAFKGFR